MTDFLSNLLRETAGSDALNVLTGTAIGYFYAFTFVMLRMAGLMTIGPVFGHPSLPVNIRVLLVVALSLVVTPAIFAETPWQTIAKYDRNGDRLLAVDEAPLKMQPRIARLLESATPTTPDGVTAEQLALSIHPPRPLADYVLTGVGEFSLAPVLGIGVTIILSGLQLAGHMIDQQSGTAVGEVFNPALNSSETVTARLLYLLGLTLFLTVGGHLSMISALLETYQAFPIGEGFVDGAAIDLLHQIFMLAVMALIAGTMGFLGLSVPQINVLVVGFPIRATVSLIVVSFALIGAGGVIVDAVEVTIEQLEYAIIGIAPSLQ